MHRSREEVEIRCGPIISRPDLVQLVQQSSSPTAAYDMVMATVKDANLARAGRWLGVLRRDYPAAYAELSRNILSHAIQGTAKENSNEGTVRETPIEQSSNWTGSRDARLDQSPPEICSRDLSRRS